jgi:hypothetical protein
MKSGWKVLRKTVCHPDVSYLRSGNLIWKSTDYTTNDYFWGNSFSFRVNMITDGLNTDKWSDAEMRMYLIKNNISEAATVANAKRNELEGYLSKNYYKTKDYVTSTWRESDMKEVNRLHIEFFSNLG